MEDDDGNHAKKGNITELSLSVASNNNNNNNNSNNNDNDNDNREAVSETINSVSDVGNGPFAPAASSTTTTQVGAANTLAIFPLHAAAAEYIKQGFKRASYIDMRGRKIYKINRTALTSTSTSTSTSTPTMSTTTSGYCNYINHRKKMKRKNRIYPTAVRSDIAAAVLKDSTMHEMINENNELQSRENKRLVVQITGKNGTPIYFEGSLKNAERYGDDHIVLRFKNGSRDGFPLSSIEIRLGGVKVQQVNIDDITIYFYNDGYDEENRMQYIWLNLFSDRGPNISGPIVRMMDAKIGPLPLGWRQRHVVGDGIDMLLTNFLELVADENNDLTPQTLKIKALVFDEKTIPGLMSFVTKEMTNYT